MNRKIKFSILTFVICILVALIFVFFIKNVFNSKNKTVKDSVKSKSTLVPKEIKNTKETALTKVKILALGDDLLHVPIITAAKTNDDRVYDFKPIYEKIKDKIVKADISFINQETVAGGPQYGVSGYPAFNSPFEIERDISDLGFDVVNQASNHSLDKTGAMESALNNWTKYTNVTVIGAARSQEERDKVRIVKSKGVKIAFLGYTYGTNGIPLPANKPYIVNLIDKEKIKEDITRAKKETDVIIVSMHWGEEYMHQQSEEQKDLAKFIADQGVTLIIGHHPHVIQPVEKLTGINGNETTVVYSLGNMISCQDSVDKLLGGMLEVNLLKDKDGKVKLENVKVTPIVTYYEIGLKNFKIVPINEYTGEMTLKHSIASMRDVSSIEKMKEISKSVLGDYCNMN